MFIFLPGVLVELGAAELLDEDGELEDDDDDPCVLETEVVECDCVRVVVTAVVECDAVDEPEVAPGRH